MAINHRFLIVKDKDNKEIKYFDYENVEGYSLKAKENAHFADCIDVNRVIIINPSFQEKIAVKKINGKFVKIINLMNFVIQNEDSDDSGDGYRYALDEADRLKRELINKYNKYLSEEKLDLMIKKLEILEKELELRYKVLLNQRIQENTLSEENTLREGRSR